MLYVWLISANLLQSALCTFDLRGCHPHRRSNLPAPHHHLHPHYPMKIIPVRNSASTPESAPTDSRSYLTTSIPDSRPLHIQTTTTSHGRQVTPLSPNSVQFRRVGLPSVLLLYVPLWAFATR